MLRRAALASSGADRAVPVGAGFTLASLCEPDRPAGGAPAPGSTCDDQEGERRQGPDGGPDYRAYQGKKPDRSAEVVPDDGPARERRRVHPVPDLTRASPWPIMSVIELDAAGSARYCIPGRSSVAFRAALLPQPRGSGRQ